MDKRTFIERAPIYYALAIAAFFRKTGTDSAAEASIRSHYFASDDEADATSGYDRLEYNILFVRGTTYLEREGFLEISLDDFGPPIYLARDGLDAVWNRLTDDRSIPFFRYRQLGERSAESWLHEALEEVNEQYNRLGMHPSDFELPDNEWEPIPLNREDPELIKAQETLEETIEGLRTDNGYAASLPEEKDFVISDLTDAAKKLRTDSTISRGFVEHKILRPLGRIIVRFGKASLGVLAEATKQAFLEWLRKKGITFLDHY